MYIRSRLRDHGTMKALLTRDPKAAVTHYHSSPVLHRAEGRVQTPHLSRKPERAMTENGAFCACSRQGVGPSADLVKSRSRSLPASPSAEVDGAKDCSCPNGVSMPPRRWR